MIVAIVAGNRAVRSDGDRSPAHTWRLRGPRPLGTDQYGRDVLSRLIWGTRISLEVSPTRSSHRPALGATIGAIAGFFGGSIEEVALVQRDDARIPDLLALALVAARGYDARRRDPRDSIAYTPRVAIVMRSIVLDDQSTALR